MIKEEVTKSTTHQVTHFDRMGYIFSVRETIDHKKGMVKGEYKVDIQANVECVEAQVIITKISLIIKRKKWKKVVGWRQLRGSRI